MNWKHLTDEKELGNILSPENEKVNLIFKHSTSCSISATALDRLTRKWNEDKMSGTETYYVDLLAYRNLSNEISRATGIAHQSPQVIVVKDGEVLYENSHFGIDYQEIEELALQSA